jgi:hypothetical protein
LPEHLQEVLAGAYLGDLPVTYIVEKRRRLPPSAARGDAGRVPCWFMHLRG